MKYPYIVVRNGVWYSSGKEVPDENEQEEHLETEKTIYTKTEINRMSTAELKAFAKEQGIDNAEDVTGAELKKVLIEKLGL